MKRFFYYFIPLAAICIGAGCSPTKTISPSANQGPVFPTQNNAGQQPERAAQVIAEPSLDLSNQELISIPSDIFSRTDLASLNLSYNKLTQAPQAEIGQLQELRVLDLSNNQLDGIPAEIGHLKNLEILNLSNNQLSGIPLELGSLKNLKVLDLTNNPYSKQDVEFIEARLPNTQIRK